MRDTSPRCFARFAACGAQWEGLPWPEAVTRLARLVGFFSRQTGIGIDFYISLAWRERFRDQFGSSRSFTGLRGAVASCLERLRREASMVTGENVYDQFAASLAAAEPPARAAAREPAPAPFLPAFLPERDAREEGPKQAVQPARKSAVAALKDRTINIRR